MLETIDVNGLWTNTNNVVTPIGKISIVDSIDIVCMRKITTMKVYLLLAVQIKSLLLAATAKGILPRMHCPRR